MERTRLASDILASVGYEESTSLLEIEFRNGGIYRYFAVPRSVFDELLQASSVGTFFLKRVKDVYGFERLS